MRTFRHFSVVGSALAVLVDQGTAHAQVPQENTALAEEAPATSSQTGQGAQVGAPSSQEPALDGSVELTLPLDDGAGAGEVISDEEVEYLGSMSLTELLRVETSVGAIGSKPLREQAGVITVITRQEIAETSARDLEEILVMQVPGFSSGQDVTGVTGLGVRGFFAYLGQLVVFIDGLEMTDALFGVFPTGSHIPAEQIEKIEIIRGPGSVSYGGNAEVAVIKVTTLGADMEGVTANTTLGTSGNGTFSHRYGTAGGMRFGEDGHVRLGASFGKNYRSDRTFVGSTGARIDLSDVSDINALLVTGGLKYKGLSFDAVLDSYRLDDRTYYGEGIDEQGFWRFDTVATSLAYSWKPTEWLTLIPKGIYNVQKPWVGKVGFPDETVLHDRIVHRLTGNLTAIADIGESSRAMLGVEGYDERAHNISGPYPLHYGETSNYIDFQSIAVFGQYELDSKIVNLTVGGRYQYHSYAGGAFVPRASLTKAWDRLHAKLMYGSSFRTPQIEMINLAFGDPVTPERGTAYELEAGYQFTDYLSLVTNAFYQELDNIIVYGVTDTDEESYVNSGELSTLGVESQIRVRDTWGNAAVTHSYYKPVKDDEKSVYGSGDDSLNLGLAAHKLTLNAQVNVTRALSVGTAMLFMTDRRGYAADAVGETVVNYGGLFVADLFANYRFKFLTVGAGVKNVFDERVDYIQPYNAYMPPLPDKSREYFLTASVNFDLDDLGASDAVPTAGFRPSSRPSL